MALLSRAFFCGVIGIKAERRGHVDTLFGFDELSIVYFDKGDFFFSKSR
jgi:hypothetical protein